MDMALIGKSIAGLRRERGFTQESLAVKLGVSGQAVSKWETGAGLPEASLLIALADALTATVDEILRPAGEGGRLISFIRRNLAAQKSKMLGQVPHISRWQPPEGCDMFYSYPAMIALALCSAEAHEEGRPAPSMAELNERFRDLMHVTGTGYGLLWNEKRHLIEELWRCNGLRDSAERAMKYCGRDLLWLDGSESNPDEAREAIMWSVDRGRPVVMEPAGGIPEFSVVTGYEDGGNVLAGRTYCEECAARTNELGMFVNPARWDEYPDFHILVIGDKVGQSYTDKDSMAFALEMLGRTGAPGEPNDFGPFAAETTGIGDGALRKWLEACDTPEHTAALFSVTDIFTYALLQNSIYTQKCLVSYFKRLGERSNRDVYGAAIQIGIAADNIERERAGLDALKDDPKKHAEACRAHIGHLIDHRESMRGWIETIVEKL